MIFLTEVDEVDMLQSARGYAGQAETGLAAACYRVASIAIDFLGSLLIAMMLAGSGWVLEWLAGIALDQDSWAYRETKRALQVTFTGAALAVAICGALMAAIESLHSVLTLWSRLEDDK